MLRIYELNNLKLPVGLPIVYNGKKVGRVIQNTDKTCKCIVDCEEVYKKIKQGKTIFSSIEVD